MRTVSLFSAQLRRDQFTCIMGWALITHCCVAGHNWPTEEVDHARATVVMYIHQDGIEFATISEDIAALRYDPALATGRCATSPLRGGSPSRAGAGLKALTRFHNVDKVERQTMLNHSRTMLPNLANGVYKLLPNPRYSDGPAPTTGLCEEVRSSHGLASHIGIECGHIEMLHPYT